jgi:hypothetical protein
MIQSTHALDRTLPNYPSPHLQLDEDLGAPRSTISLVEELRLVVALAVLVVVVALLL